VEAGGSEPGFINAVAALKRAAWFKGCNPCAEILLGDKSFCNLVEIDVGKFNGDYQGLCEAARIIARANYRQTCVNLDDGMLQRTWHELNEFLRLTGVGLTGIVRWKDGSDPSMVRGLKNIVKLAVHNMADELALPRSQATTTLKPSGTLGKIMDTTEGLHKPLGRYIINNVKFSRHDDIVAACIAAGYRSFDDPNDPTAILVSFPVAWEDVEFDTVERDGKTLHVNLESAVTQLDRYKFWMQNWVDHNASVTISYDPSEVPAIIEWIDMHWDSYVGVSFLFRADPTKTAADLGYPYLPQEVTTKEAYDEYVSQLRPLVVSASSEEIMDAECTTGACPMR
jgi:ribonucleoside-triphosphate reductase